ncbi:MAG: twin-arginine translocase subunit TatC [Alphaproteobacteria bacterium]|nr:twin-arginine translocase subunit TatC [Alphaproteobacteria bacterium]
MKNMTLMQHFSELKRRILWTMAIFVLAFVAGWYVAPFLQSFLTMPLINVWPDGALLYTSVTDGLMIQFSLGALFALLISVPVVFWHIWAFVKPGLKKSEQNFIWPILFLSPVLFVAGAAFVFYFLFPIVFDFFIELNRAVDVPNIFLPDVRNYLHFVIKLLTVFGVAFQLPLVLIMLNKIGILHRSYVVKMRRYAIVFIVILAAILTPPDVVSQLLLALPMWGLFELSILFMRK